MKRTHNLGDLDWTLAGYTPHVWRQEKSMELGLSSMSAIAPIPASVPGSVQKALLNAGLLPDWNVGLNARHCEWVENRHWVYEARLPDEWLATGKQYRLRCLGLDYEGVILLNGEEIGTFKGTHIPHIFDLTAHTADSDNVLKIVFEIPPRWLGQCGRTSEMRDWKPRFNYTWDWISRLVQIGLWDDVLLEVVGASEIESLSVGTDADPESGTGTLELSGVVVSADHDVLSVELSGAGGVIRSEQMSVSRFTEQGLDWQDLDIELWWPNGAGEQHLYSLAVSLSDADGKMIDRQEKRVGFKNVSWERCEAAPEAADPWICVINGLPVFLKGINWSPIRPNFADVPESEYRKRITLYRDLNMNTFRVNGCSFLEKECFHELCDELGLLVWQDFPLSSSGIDNEPPYDETSIDEMATIASSVIRRRRHHASLLCWCGGNELQVGLDGASGIGKPLDLSHPMLARLDQIVADLDPGRRFIATSPIGPRFTAEIKSFGKGIHWEVHGPWRVDGSVEDFKASYWDRDDALFRSEVGAPGPSGADLIRKYKGDCDEMPASLDNPLWRRTSWWIEWDAFIEELGREPQNLEEYVAWGQSRQADALAAAAASCVKRFPAIGGMLIWHGHDCFPCAANTALIDFEGNPKPAAYAVGEVFGTAN
jgi:beta-mannosidase